MMIYIESFGFLPVTQNGRKPGSLRPPCEDCTNDAKSSAMSPQTKAALGRLQHPYAITGRAAA